MNRSFTGDPELDQIVSRELRYNQTRWTEIWTACIMVGMGAILWAKGDTFTSTSFVVIRQYVNEDQAGFIAIITGVIRLFALYINGSYKRTPIIRVIGCVGGFFFFSALAYGLFLAAPPLGLGIATYGFLAIAELHSSGRAARDAFAYDSLGTRQRRRESAQRYSGFH